MTAPTVGASVLIYPDKFDKDHRSDGVNPMAAVITAVRSSEYVDVNITDRDGDVYSVRNLKYGEPPVSGILVTNTLWTWP